MDKIFVKKTKFSYYSTLTKLKVVTIKSRVTVDESLPYWFFIITIFINLNIFRKTK